MVLTSATVSASSGTRLSNPSLIAGTIKDARCLDAIKFEFSQLGDAKPGSSQEENRLVKKVVRILQNLLQAAVKIWVQRPRKMNFVFWNQVARENVVRMSFYLLHLVKPTKISSNMPTHHHSRMRGKAFLLDEFNKANHVFPAHAPVRKIFLGKKSVQDTLGIAMGFERTWPCRLEFIQKILGELW